VAAHILDGDLRRLSFERDGLAPPAVPEGVPFPAFLGGLNHQWVGAMARVSDRSMTDLLAWSSPRVAEF
jgi:hypothetical protein